MSAPSEWPLVCEEEGCKHEPLVGVGEPPRFVCGRHFEAYMAGVRRTLEGVARELGAIAENP